MITVEKGIIKYNGDVIGLVEESRYPVPAILNIEYDEPRKYEVRSI